MYCLFIVLHTCAATIIGLQPVDDVEEGQDSQVCISIDNSGGSVGTRSFSIDYTTENIGEAIGI